MKKPRLTGNSFDKIFAEEPISIDNIKFNPGDKVICTITELDGIVIPEDTLTIMNVKEDSMYRVIGPNNLSLDINGKYLKRI